MTKIMTTCRCTAIKNLTADLVGWSSGELSEIGLGEEMDIDAFNRFADIYRIIFYLRRGLPVAGYKDQGEVHDRHLSDRMPLETFEALGTTEAALILFQTLNGR